MLLTKDNREALPALYAQDGKGMDAVAYVKLFDPCGRFTMFVTEFDGDDTLYGYTVSPLGPDCDEWGYGSLAELAAVDGPLGIGIERDRHFTPCTVGEALA